MNHLPALVRRAAILGALLILLLFIVHLTTTQDSSAAVSTELSNGESTPPQEVAEHLAVTDTPDEPDPTTPPQGTGNGGCSSAAVVLPLAVVTMGWWTFRKWRE